MPPTTDATPPESCAGPGKEEPAPPDSATLLWATRPWALKNQGAVCEGNVFSILFALEHVVRSFEFAPVDGASCLDTLTHAPQSSYAERLLCARDHELKNPQSRRFMQFDVKSTTGLEAGTQTTITHASQNRRVAFYLLMCVADPGYVALIPSVRSSGAQGEGHFAVSSSKHLAIRGASYGYLDPGIAGHRMPIGLLPAAVERVRECAITGKDYVNPWTGLAYAGWKPLTTTSLDDLRPREHVEAHTAFLSTLTLWRELRLAREEGDDVSFDVLGLQPRLADLKIIYKGRQWLVQCKGDARERRFGHFGRVPIARSTSQKLTSAERIEEVEEEEWGEGSQTTVRTKYYFSSFDRFDFLLYELRFSDGEDRPPTTGFFFLPERVLPDEFFTSSEETREVSFDRAEFREYYATAVDKGDMARHALDVMDRNPVPRRAHRPHRGTVLEQPLALRVAARLKQLGVPQALRGCRPAPSRTTCHRRLFDGLADQCARRLSGILVALGHNHPACDFGFAPYRWTESERDAYRSTGTPPATIHTIPPSTPVVPFYAFSRDMACDWRGPMLSGAEFRRVNAWKPARLLLFDAMAAEDPSFPGPLFLVPTTDLSVTPRQLRELTDHANIDKKAGDRHGRVPLIRELLHSGHNVADYVVSGGGPFLYRDAGDGWGELWTLLDRFAGTVPFRFPLAHDRSPEDYRSTVQQLHTRWWEVAGPQPGPSR